MAARPDFMSLEPRPTMVLFFWIGWVGDVCQLADGWTVSRWPTSSSFGDRDE